MSLKIENAEQLAGLLANVEHDFDQLQGLLLELKDKDPAVFKEELAHKERMRNLVHAERVKALEMGHMPADSGEVVRTRSAVRGATAIALVVSIALACAATGTSAIILILLPSHGEVRFFGVTTDFQAALFAIVWGVCGLITIYTVFACLRIIRRSREPSPQRPTSARAREDRPSLP